MKKIISIALVLCMVVSVISVGAFSSSAAETSKVTSSAGSTAAQKTVQGSAILHCFDWSYNSIKSNLKAIADAGYTAVQTSPIQPPKDYNANWNDQGGQWWKLYQPLGIRIAESNQSWLGGKNELKALCAEADKYGIKVICDIVANHLADKGMRKNGLDNVSDAVDSDLRRSEYWHNNGLHADDDNNREHMTMGAIDLPDLNTGNSYIQNKYKQLLIDCINIGVDGFRFDAAKHIELPTDGSFGSQFWPTVINGSQSASKSEIYYYGEILNGAGTNINNYTKYMSITDNYTSDSKLVAANNNNASGLAASSYSKGAGGAKSVLWCESHDTYMGGSGSAGLGNTKNVSNATIVKTWAIIAGRAEASALFFARPAANMGAASTDTTWKSKEVSAVNKFKNYFDGESEYLSSEGDTAYVERGTSGVVISKLGGGGNVTLTAHKMKDGTYTDQISGGTFKVSGGKISGKVSNSGVAVVYNEKPAGPSAIITPGSTSYKTDTLQLTLTFNNAKSGQYSIDGGSYQSFTNNQKITIGKGADYGTVTTLKVKASDGSKTSDVETYSYTKLDPNQVQKVYFDNSNYKWSKVNAYIYTDENNRNGAWPGVEMQYDSTTGLYYLEIPENLKDASVIFTEDFSSTDHRYPADGEPGMELGGNSMIFKSNHEWTEYIAVTPQPSTAKPTEKPTTTPTKATETEKPSTGKPTTAPTTKPEPSETQLKEDGKYGDVNNDGNINIIDVTQIQKSLASLIELSTKGKILANVNGDLRVNIKDATYIQKYIAKMNDTANVGKIYYSSVAVEPTVPATSAPTPTQEPTEKPTEAPTQPKPTETEPESQEPSSEVIEGNRVVFNNPDGWQSVRIHYWKSENGEGTTWPGEPMKQAGSQWYYDIPDGYDMCIFNDGGSAQTADLTVESQKGSISGEQTPTRGDNSDGSYVYFDNAEGWQSPHVYFWKDGGGESQAWPGHEMQQDGNVWKFQIPGDYDKCVFNDGGGGKSGDQTIQPGKTFHYREDSWS